MTSLHQWVDALLSVLLAPRCAACKTSLAAPLSGAVCDDCWRAVTLITPPVCRGCGAPLPATRDGTHAAGICRRCRRLPRAVDASRAVGAYDGTLRDILHALKYDGRRSLAPRLARLMTRYCADVLVGADVAVPVPLHPRRRRRRGFNQAEELATHLGLPPLAALRRTRDTPPQTSLAAASRRRNVRGAFAISARMRLGAWFLRASHPWRKRAPARSVAGRVVVLVDDVSTTGATLEACARILKAAGAREVRALTVARAGRRRA